jgi:thiol:disulfide interchange protein
MKNVLKVSGYQVLLMLVLFAFASCGSKNKLASNKVINSVDFLSNTTHTLTEVIELASAQNKKVFVDFHADWCLPCKLLDEEVFNQRDVYTYFNRNFINYKVDIEKANGANLKLMYGANELPTLIFLDEKGSVITRNNGQVGQTFIMSMAKNLGN